MSLAIAATVVGGVGWSGHALALPLAVLFPALWAWSPSRAAAAIVSAAYFLAASRGLPQGVATYFGASVWAGIALWLTASLAFVAVHAGLWTGRPGIRRLVGYCLAAVLMAVPPFGITGWAHPITAAGVLFPGWGWWGLAATSFGLLVMTTRAWIVAGGLMLGAWGWSTIFWMLPPAPPGWIGLDTQLGATLGRGDALALHRLLIRLVDERAAAGAKVVVLPESALGPFTPTVESLWIDRLSSRDVRVVAGAAIIDGQGYDNVMVELGRDGARTAYRARMPVPVSMWQPWRTWLGQSGGAHATFFADPLIEVADRRLAPLICYEQLIVWPMLQSALWRPDLIVATGNTWWATGTSVPAIQRASVEAWARLFELSLIVSSNS